MRKLEGLKPESLFSYFEDISAIPRGSGVRSGIRDYLVNFAKERNLEFYADEADNVIIYKKASAGYENAEGVILQSHTDIVWQKTADCDIDFEKEGLRLYVDGDFIKAEGTTLGADNGLGVAAALAVLDDDSLSHPAIEAVFTSDEEIGMIGAGKLDMTRLSGKKLINMDAEEPEVLTVSCAGGSDFIIKIPVEKMEAAGTHMNIKIAGLLGGHSGIQISEGRVNADMLLGRILNHMSKHTSFYIKSVSGGTKANAIPLESEALVIAEKAEDFKDEFDKYVETVKEEISSREPSFMADCEILSEEKNVAFKKNSAERVIALLTVAPNGVMEMSKEIDNLVETSLNLGILETAENFVKVHFALRSNKESALYALEEKMTALTSLLGAECETFGHYPPWEFKKNSPLQDIYKRIYKEKNGKEPSVEAIHAGLECGLFSSEIEGLDAIAIGALLMDVHTVGEKLSISSTESFYDILVKVLENCR
ncbi:MAG: aminoacyl-histidine dipeptidase [Clostridia bacterium]|nr:aminoacyl-histidine dipeptidase [Clostridia bacterium]